MIVANVLVERVAVMQGHFAHSMHVLSPITTHYTIYPFAENYTLKTVDMLMVYIDTMYRLSCRHLSIDVMLTETTES